MKHLSLIFLISLHLLIAKAQVDYTPNFTAGKPQEMTKLEFMKGQWRIELFQETKKSNQEVWKLWAQSSSEITSIYDGTFIQEFSKGFPIEPKHEGFDRREYFANFSFDRHKKVYRFTYHDNLTGLLSIFEGNFNAQGHLSLQMLANPLHKVSETSIEIIIHSKEEFELIWYNTNSNKNIWNKNIKMVYKKTKY